MDVNQEISPLDAISSALENKMVDNVTSLPIELTNATGTYLQHLNEDCLLEIFSSKSLTPMDLCSLAETCNRFKRITQRVLSRGFAINCSPGYTKHKREYRLKAKHLISGDFTIHDVERMLRTFGQHLSTLTLRDYDVMQLVEKYCDNVKLRRLKIQQLHIGDVTLFLNASTFERLQKLSFDLCYCGNNDVSALNSDLLVELKILNSHGCDVVLRHTFPNLERLIIRRTYVTNNFDTLFDFIRRHGHLKAIRIFSLCDESNGSIIPLHVINSSCKNLEELTLGCLMSPKVPPIASNMEMFAKLKMLDLNFECCDYSHIFPFLIKRGLRSLETMRIKFIRNESTKVFNDLPQLPNLRELHLTDCPVKCIPWTMLTRLRKVYLCVLIRKLNSADLLNIVRQLINLEELEYYGNSCVYKVMLTEKDYLDIVKIVQRREHVLTLKGLCNFKPLESCERDQKVKLINIQ